MNRTNLINRLKGKSDAEQDSIIKDALKKDPEAKRHYQRMYDIMVNALDKKRHVANSTSYLESIGELSFPEGLFSKEFQFACIAAGHKRMTPYEMIKLLNKEKPNGNGYNTKGMKVGAIMDNSVSSSGWGGAKGYDPE